MKYLLAILLITSNYAIAQSYKESSCYKEYEASYEKGNASRKKTRDLNRRAAGYGMTLSNNTESDFGKEDKSVMNAALESNTRFVEGDNIKGYKLKSQQFGKAYLNRFDWLFTKIDNKFPGVSPEQIIDIVQEGFSSGEFCQKFLFFPGHKAMAGVKRYVSKNLEAKTVRKLAVEVFDEDGNKEVPEEKQTDSSNTSVIEY
jgi:hypothetical protein